MFVILSKLRFYTGDEEQLPDPSLESLPAHRGGGVGNVPAYRGTAYMVVTNDDLTQTGGRIRQWKFEMASNATVTETCNEAGLIFHFPLYSPQRGEPAVELVADRNGLYSDTATIEPGDNLHVLGIGSTEFTSTFDYMVAETPVAEITDHPFSMENRTNWTIIVWFKMTDTAGGSVFKNISALWGDQITGLPSWQFCLDDDEDNTTVTFRASFAGPGTGVRLQGSSVTTGSSHMLAATYDADTELLYFYQDGQRVAQESVPYGSFQSGGENAIICGGGSFPGSYGFIGMVQDLKAFDFTLTDLEIYNRFLADPNETREAPDAPGTYIRRVDGYTVTQCRLESEIGEYMLSDAITDICRRVGIDSDQLDVTADENIPIDYLVARNGTEGTGAILPLATAFFRDYIDTGLLISSVPRGGAVVEELVDDDFLVHEEEVTSLRQSIELPRRLNLAFWDRSANARLLAFAERESQNVSSEGAPTIELPLVLDRDIATQKAHVLQKVLAEEAQGRITRALPFYKYANLTVSDPITVDGKRHRIERMQVAGGRMEFDAVRDRVSNYSSNATAGQVIDPATPVSSLKGPTWLQALNLPRLRTQDNQPGMYLAATGATEGWPGCLVYMSTDNGATFQQVTTISRRALMGNLVSSIGPSTEPILIQTWDGRDLVSVTDEQLAAKQNAFALTTSSVSEVCQFKNSDESEDTDNEFSLTTVSRGLLSTTAASHTVGDEFLLLDTALVFLPISASYAGQTLIFRAVTRGTPVENNPTISVTFLPQFLGPEEVEYMLEESNETMMEETGGFMQEEE
jgi:hypothetical protein